ncbi:hypothetical protein FB45DRAFT_1006708 [Roridomyces roridus]|uniref:Uncharacterized protein n=1 Tax=Roridomyces roridus TaxID=1738132 RepID=A0AAD7BI05_9AGAR|nr:hypothetical protein FB45DRAFT_1006708 [Roridomyces roridus]
MAPTPSSTISQTSYSSLPPLQLARSSTGVQTLAPILIVLGVLLLITAVLLGPCCCPGLYRRTLVLDVVRIALTKIVLVLTTIPRPPSPAQLYTGRDSTFTPDTATITTHPRALSSAVATRPVGRFPIFYERAWPRLRRDSGITSDLARGSALMLLFNTHATPGQLSTEVRSGELKSFASLGMSSWHASLVPAATNSNQNQRNHIAKDQNHGTAVSRLTTDRSEDERQIAEIQKCAEDLKTYCAFLAICPSPTWPSSPMMAPFPEASEAQPLLDTDPFARLPPAYVRPHGSDRCRRPSTPPASSLRRGEVFPARGVDMVNVGAFFNSGRLRRFSSDLLGSLM